MCGVLAVLNKHHHFLKAMDAIAHRGKRQVVMETRRGMIGHARLPIVGIGSENDQPFRRGHQYFGFVGEILDFREKDPTAECDLQTVVNAWSKEGPSGLRHHDGFWAVVMLDDLAGELHVLCDYLAQKPMYYRVDSFPSVASEPNALVALASVTIDEIYMSSVIKWGYCPDTVRTPYNEIKHVLPGEHVVLNYHGVSRRKIVDPLCPVTMSEPALKKEIEAAVKRRVLSSDVPVGILISGGLDSSIVYNLAQRHGKVRPYFADTEAKDFERDAVYLLMKDVLEPNYHKLTHVDWDADDITKGLHLMQEPIDLGSLLPQCALANAVKEDVCLTGDGADEVFGGYGRSTRYDSQWTDIYHELVAWHLPRLDRIMMSNCIEVRSPFLARQVVQGAMGLPHSRRQNKEALRDMFRKDLPIPLADQPKMPLRSSRIEFDREANSQVLVGLFRSWHEETTRR